ncbi:ACT-like protein [Dioscorea alata]|uniref:ACT-like protein n=1 Tax=Dioscorea alata TaxID=55571 RepID=A0ACB7VYP6_DIOAL|nr:ACT-like protein [Dioscorea alata]
MENQDADHHFHPFQQDQSQQQQQQQQLDEGFAHIVSTPSFIPPLPPLPPPPPFILNPINQLDHHHHFLSSVLPPLPPPPPPPPQPYHPHHHHDLYTRRASAALHFAYDVGGLGSSSSDPLGFSTGFMRASGAAGVPVSPSSSSPFTNLHVEFSKMSAQEIMDAKALAASKSHSEAERRRRERINAHLAKLRSLLPSTTKTDKASLLAEVIQHVKELKRQTSEIAEESPLPTESDELTVDAANDEDGKFIVKASLCCDDRTDLLPDLIKALKALRLRTLKAEITTLGGRVKNVLLITGEDDSCNQINQLSITSIQDALKAVMERAAAEETSSAGIGAGGIKRQRTNSLSSILEHRSI